MQVVASNYVTTVCSNFRQHVFIDLLRSDSKTTSLESNYPWRLLKENTF